MNFVYEKSRIFARNDKGKLIAEITFPEISNEKVNITRVFVDESLRGQGIASELVKKAYYEIKRQNKKATLTCPYAIKWFGKNRECSDILE